LSGEENQRPPGNEKNCWRNSEGFTAEDLRYILPELFEIKTEFIDNKSEFLSEPVEEKSGACFLSRLQSIDYKCFVYFLLLGKKVVSIIISVTQSK